MSHPAEPELAARVLVTRPSEDAPALAGALGRSGYHPVLVPLIERQWSIDPVVEAANEHPEVDWVIVTAGPSADVLATAAPSAWRNARWAAVGEATAHRLAHLGYPVHLVPRRATARDLVEALGDLSGQRVLYPRADLASRATVEALERAGASVVDVVAYRNVAPAHHEKHLSEALPVDATTLMSGSAAGRVADAVPASSWETLGAVVCIGPSTAKVAEERGLPVRAVARPHSIAGLVAALQRVLPPY